SLVKTTKARRALPAHKPELAFKSLHLSAC
ncbi:MAG: hypothetical protein ACI93H_000876, partial [Psychromonas sp.]